MGVDLIIGLDVGTTAAKATVFGVDARVHATGSREYPLLGPRPGWHVQEPDAVAAGVLEALADAVAQVEASDVLGISISTAMHGLVGLDADHRPLTELITWAGWGSWRASARGTTCCAARRWTSSSPCLRTPPPCAPNCARACRACWSATDASASSSAEGWGAEGWGAEGLTVEFDLRDSTYGIRPSEVG